MNPSSSGRRPAKPSIEKLGILGGTFDPVHLGHLILAREMAEALALDRVLFIPADHPPHKDPDGVSEARHRLAMLELATSSEPDFLVDDREIARGGRSYTLETLQSLAKDFGPDTEFYFLIGADSLPELKTWYRSQELFALAHFATAVRPGFSRSRLDELGTSFPPEVIEDLKAHLVPTTPIGISSTQIRHNILSGKLIRYYVPPAVEQYIGDHRLYRPGRNKGGGKGKK